MSRHRRERVPRHRAQRSAGYQDRRAIVTAAEPGIGLAGTWRDATETAPLAALTAGSDGAIPGLVGLAAPGDGALDDGAPDNDAAPGRRPPSHSRRRSRRVASGQPGSARASGLAGKHPSVARGLLMTPWFAAGTGFVIAASLWIYSPHPQLAFPAIAIGKPPCGSGSCGSELNQQGAGRLAIKSGQRETQPHQSAPPAKARTPRTRAAASGLTFGYVVRQTAPDEFQLVISVTGKRAVKNWELAFVLPGDQIRAVFGAHWRASGSDGGTASPFTGDQGQYDPGGYGSGPAHHGYGNGGAAGQSRVSFTVVASGAGVAPADCRFDGATCAFHELSSPSQDGR
jgi:hypothetical protein